MTQTERVENRFIVGVRMLILAVFIFGLIGAGAELVLLEHTEDGWMWTPLVLMGLGLLALAVYFFYRASVVLRVFRWLMILFIVSGMLGIWLHYKGNVEFELEMYPALAGFELFWKAMKGATPALAPGTMTQLGLTGLIYTYKHPKLLPQTGK